MGGLSLVALRADGRFVFCASRSCVVCVCCGGLWAWVGPISSQGAHLDALGGRPHPWRAWLSWAVFVCVWRVFDVCGCCCCVWGSVGGP